MLVSLFLAELRLSRLYGVNPASPLVRRRATTEPVHTAPSDTVLCEPKVYYTMTNPDPWKPTGPGGPVAELLVSSTLCLCMGY